YIVGQYRQVQLVPVFPDYQMQFNFDAGLEPKSKKVNNETANQISFENTKLKVEIVPLPFGKPSTVTGELIDGQFCLPPHKGKDELAEINKLTSIVDKIIVCERYGPYGKALQDSNSEDRRHYQSIISFVSKYENLKRFKPKAIIFLKGDGSLIETNQFRQITEDKTDSQPLAVFSSNNDFIKLVKLKKQIVKLTVNFGPVEMTGINIGAALKPIQPNQKIIYVGAHYDHLGYGLAGSSMGPTGQIYNGADDNASGTALIIELAVAMKSKLDSDPTYLPKDTNVVFLNFDAEERGLFGSSRFVDSSYFNSSQAIAMINADMVGRLRKSRGLFIQGTDTADESLKTAIEKSYTNTIGKIYSVEERPDIRFMAGGFGPSDHASFYRKKVPVVFLFTGSHKEYHRPEDDSYLISYKGLYSLTLLTEQIVRRISFNQPLKFKLAKEEPKRNDFDFDVRLGIIPGSYEEGNDGLLVGGVVDGAPVAKTGVKDGDIIIQIGDQTIGNIHDLMSFLSDARTGVKYKIFWRRNGQQFQSITELMSSSD
ncbi:MAG: M28 family peptidase, partial [Leptonema sp. (in: Bacteria)]|nr:M28 family peptidase [Leptonema sp. (in: bacteria)]